jgi:hypothetical protein
MASTCRITSNNNYGKNIVGLTTNQQSKRWRQKDLYFI